MQVDEIFGPEIFDEAYSKQLFTLFSTNKPIRHLVIDNFLKKEFADSIYNRKKISYRISIYAES